MKALRTAAIVAFMLVQGVCHAREDTGDMPDSLRISLLTCSPYEEIYALYGHTAIRVEDLRTGADFVVNYGLFSFDEPFFALRFVFGITDYEMGVESFRGLRRKYAYYKCGIIQQELNLTNEEKEAILAAMAVNYMPENRVYRYNYFYDNCTTRARNIIANNIKGSVSYGDDNFSGPTFRELVHACTAHRPWAKFGDDLLLGVMADVNTTRTEYQFLPFNLMRDFDNAWITDSSGESRPLVASKTVVLEAGVQEKAAEFPLSPLTCGVVLLVVTIAVTVCERLMRRQLYVYDAVLMTACGLLGIILFAMLFSQHPTVRVNFQLLLLNPLPLFLVWRMVKRTRRGQLDWQYKMWTALILLFLLGGVWQTYAEGMHLLACSLLTRNVARLI